VKVTLNGAAAGSLPATEDSEETSSFSGTLAVPGTVTCGANTVGVTLVYTPEQIDAPQDARADPAGAAAPQADAADGTATITAYCPAITVSPAAAGNGQLPATYTVTPTGFPPLGDGETLTLDQAPVTFPQFTASPACGVHAVTLSQPFTEQTTGERSIVRIASASAQIEVLCPQITLAPSSFPLASEPVPVQVTGTEFHPGQPVTITLDGAPAGAGTTNRDGGFTIPISAAGLDCGAHQVTVTEQPTDGGPAVLFSLSAALQVTRCTLKLSVPPVVVPGQAAHVTGTGFAPGQPVTLTWRRAVGGPLQGTLKLTASSAGAISGYFLVVPLDGLGSRQAVAAQGKLRLVATTLVTPWPAQPGPGGQLVDRG
jgi:hypothetical protein